MNLSKVFESGGFRISDKVSDKASALSLIADQAACSSALSGVSRETILSALKAREEIGSTGFQDGVAIPHCRLSGISEFTAGLLLLPDGVEFFSADGKPAQLIFFIIAPAGCREEHIRLLSAISRAVINEEVREDLLSAETEADLEARFLAHMPVEIKTAESRKQSFFWISIQREGLFRDILSAVSSLTGTVMVQDGTNASGYLPGMPLFSLFWNERAEGFNKTLTGLIDSSLTNELIRSLDSVAGGLDEHAGVVIAVCETQMAAGNLIP